MIFDRTNQSAEERLKNVLISDKQFCPERIKKVLRSDAYNMLANYCNLEPENLIVDLEVAKDGTYIFNVSATANRLKIFGSLPDWCMSFFTNKYKILHANHIWLFAFILYFEE